MRKRNLHEQVISEIQNFGKLIKESYVFDDETSSYNEDEMLDEYPSDEEDDMNIESNDKISQIRSIALDGIQEYADDVDSDEYDFFKKIWLMCDKVCSEKDNQKNDEM